MIADIRHALRGFRKSPGLALAVLAALALGIGANTAIFTVINTVLLNPLPYPGANRIVSFARTGGGAIAMPLFAYWDQNNSGFEDLAAYQHGASMNLTGGTQPQLVDALQTSQKYFHLFGANPILGRTFTSAEDLPGGPQVLLLSYDLWQRRFGGDPSIVSRAITLGGASYSINGVISPGFQSYPPVDVWIPLQADPNSTNQAGVLSVAARLPEGLTFAQAKARLAVLGTRYGQANSAKFRNNSDIEVAPLRQRLTGEVRPALLILMGAVGLVLLIACANVANLLLARASARQKEIAIREAIGAGRARIVRQLLTESLLLALAGGTLGLALGSWGVRALLVLVPGDLPRTQELVGLDPRVAGFTFLLAIITGIAFGLFPALALARTEPSSVLKAAVGSLKKSRTRNVLVAAEVAIAVVLLCGAMLLIRSFAAMHSVSLGFDAHNLLTMEVSLAGPGYSRSSDVDRLMRQVVERVEQIPGVQSAAMASALPLYGKMDMIFNIPGRTPAVAGQFTGDVQWRFVSAHYFDALRIPLISGRYPREQEPGRTVVINEAMARKYWPDANPVGQTIWIGQGLGAAYDVGATEVIGVTADVRDRLESDSFPVMYEPPSQIPDADMALVNGYEPGGVLVRTRPGVAPMSVSQPVQQALLSIAKIPASKVRTLEQAGLDSTPRQNFNLLLLGMFAAIALLLAGVGIYGVMSYSVEQRTHEIGIRAALGANRREALSLILRQALLVATAGIAVGVIAAIGLTDLLRAQLFSVKPTDPLTFIAVPLILLLLAVASAAIPAIRATRVDPITALRHE
jgi:putative ABC transport system permease protein